MELWLATGNRGKLIEFQTLLPQLNIHTQNEMSYFTAPEETGKTFTENARLKARALRAVKNNVWVVGEDSGLEVIGLNNFPGVHSARYAGPRATDQENIAKLLKMMSLRSAQKREARFQCFMIAYSPEGKEHLVQGTLNGSISERPRGTEGFGYDPVFIPVGQQKTLAELGLTFKNQISHRAQAIKKLQELWG